MEAVPEAPGTTADLWTRAAEAAGSKQLRTIMASLRPVEINAARILVACDGPMRKMVEGRLAEIEDMVRRIGGGTARVELAPGPGEAGTPAQAKAVASVTGLAVEEPEIVRLAAELFGARVVNVQRKERGDGEG